MVYIVYGDQAWGPAYKRVCLMSENRNLVFLKA